MSQPSEISADVHKQLLAGLDIFNPSRLATEDDITVALNVLEGSLDNTSIGPIILCSLQPEHPYVFEFIVSCKFALFAPAVIDTHAHASRQRRQFQTHFAIYS
jgi:hypothetical protein